MYLLCRQEAEECIISILFNSIVSLVYLSCHQELDVSSILFNSIVSLVYLSCRQEPDGSSILFNSILSL